MRRSPVGLMSPRDVIEWGVTLDPALLAPGETITAVTWSLDATYSAIGVVVTDLGLQNDTTYGKIGYARVEVALAQQAHERWSGDGVIVPVRARVETSLDLAIERSLPIRISRDLYPAQAYAARIMVLGAAS